MYSYKHNKYTQNTHILCKQKRIILDAINRMTAVVKIIMILILWTGHNLHFKGHTDVFKSGCFKCNINFVTYYLYLLVRTKRNQKNMESVPKKL